MILAAAALALLAAAARGADAQDVAASRISAAGLHGHPPGPAASSVDAAFHAVAASSALLPGDVTGAEEEPEEEEGRMLDHRELVELQQDQIAEDHKYRELPCNAVLPDVPAKPTKEELKDLCDALSTVTATVGGETVIPCGSCVYVDTTGEIDLPNGLDIHGKLVFPHNHPDTTVRTPFVFLQGVLQITNDEEVSPASASGVKFFMTGAADVTFTPHVGHFDTTPYAANTKPFIVAGGRLDVDAFPAGCPTWLNIRDVVYDEYESGVGENYLAPIDPPADCSREIIKTDFESGGQDTWKGMLGGIDTLETDAELDLEGNTVSSNSYLRVANRTRDWQGPTVDLTAAQRACFTGSATEYTFAARFRLYREDGQPTACSSTGTNCLKLTAFHRNNDNRDDSTDKNRLQATQGPGYGTYSDLVKDGEWFVWTGRFKLNYGSEGTPGGSIANRLRFTGPEAGAVIEMDDVRIGLPEVEAYVPAAAAASGAICQDLFPADKAADGYLDPPKYPYPLRSVDIDRWSQVLVLQESDVTAPGGVNSFYRLAHRWDEWQSLSFDLAGGCLRLGAYYRVNFRARINHPDVFLESKVEIRVMPRVGGHWSEWGDAPESPAGNGTGWVQYTKEIIVSQNMADAAADGRVEFRLNTAWPGSKWGTDQYADIDYDDLEIKLVHGPIKGLVVDDPAVKGCWGPGSEIVVAPHTTEWHERQVVTLDAVTPVDVSSGKTVLKLATALSRHPTTAVQDPMQSTEVGLLGRNVKFVGDDDVNNRGGYLLVMNTFNVTQKLRGVEIRNFGYQKVGNRYPIGFDKLDVVPDGLIEANVIRESQFRCVIMSGVSGVLIKDNVAYDNRGICYGTLKGKEIVTFERNLAIRTADRWTDGGNTASFFIRDPRAVLKGNVAAGSERRGFNYNMKHYVDGNYRKMTPAGNWNPRDKPLGGFEDNVAHSCADWGLLIGDYHHPRFNEPVNTQTYRNYRGYKSANNAWVRGRDLAFEGFYLADAKHRNMMLYHCDNCAIRDATVVGYSEDYRAKVADQSLWHVCTDESTLLDRMRGFEIPHMQWWRDWWTWGSTPPGVTFENVTFSQFHDTGCARTSPLYAERRRQTPHFDNFLSFKSVRADTPAAVPSLCTFEDLEVQDVAIADLDSTLHPDGPDAFDGASSIVSDHPWMQAFAGGPCVSDADKCSAYCEDTCLRTVTYDVSPYETEDVTMLVTDLNSGKAASFPGNFEVSKKNVDGALVPDVYHNTFYHDTRKFSLALPAGNFSAKFVDKEGNDYWPTFAYVSRWERDPACGGVQRDQLVLEEPPAPTLEECSELVRNGNIASGNYTHWNHVNGGAAVVDASGADWTDIDEDRKGGAYSLLNARWSKDYGIGFHVDQRCLSFMKGREYVIHARIRLQDADGAPKSCDPDSYDEYTGCPNMWAQPKDFHDATKASTAVNYPNLAMSVRPNLADGGYTLIEGTFVVDATMADADKVLFWITRGGADQLSVDSASIRLLDRADPEPATGDVVVQQTAAPLVAPLPAPACPEQFIVNGDFELADTTQYWRNRGGMHGKLALVSPGADGSGNAIQMTDTKDNNHPYQGPIQWINPTCFEEGTEYEVSARFRLTDPAIGNDVKVCDPLQTSSSHPELCPIITIFVWTDTWYGVFHLARTVSPGDDSGEWGTIHGIVPANSQMATAVKAFVYVEYAPHGLDLTVDDFSVKPYVLECTNVVKNGDFEVGTTQHWGQAGAVVDGKGYPSVDGNPTKALVMTGRTSRDNLLEQDLDKGCIEHGTNYLLQAKVKMYKNGAPIKCNMNVVGGDEECPIADLRTDGPEARSHIVGAVCAELDDDWYYIRGTFEFYPYDVAGTLLRLRFYRAPAGVDLVIDDVELTKVEEASPA